MICDRCGHENPRDSRFCSSCGAALEPPGAEGAHDGGTRVIPTVAPQTGGIGDETTSTLETSDADDDDMSEYVELGSEGMLPGTALLVVQRGPSSGSRFLLDAEVISAGRHPDSDIFLDDVTVSRRHAELVRGPGGYRVRDVGSLNGTYVNRDRIDDVALGDKDEVQIGKFRLVYLAGPASGDV